MEPSSKKPKLDPKSLTPSDARKIIESFSQDQLITIIAAAICRNNPPILHTVRRIADRDPLHRKLFVRRLGWETTTDNLRSIFSTFGELSDAAVIQDKLTGKSKGYGFVTFRHVDSAILALRDPNKMIDNRMTITQLAAAGADSSSSSSFLRKIFVGNVPAEMPYDRLRAFFGSYGEIEEGPLGFDKQSGKFKGYALFVYKTVRGSQLALLQPTKNVDGISLQCKLASDGKKGRSGPVVAGADGIGTGSQSSTIGFASQFGGGGSSYGVAAGIGHSHQLNSPLQSSIGGMSGGQFGSSSQYAGAGGYGGFGMGSSLYRMPPSSVGMHSSELSSSSSMYQAQQHQAAGGGMYHSAPRYF